MATPAVLEKRTDNLTRRIENIESAADVLKYVKQGGRFYEKGDESMESLVDSVESRINLLVNTIKEIDTSTMVTKKKNRVKRNLIRIASTGIASHTKLFLLEAEEERGRNE